MKRWWVIAAVGLAGCGSGVDHERLGDEAVAVEDLALAVAEYRASLQSGESARVLVKLGTVALSMGEWDEAIQAFRDLESTDPSSSLQAATGLELAARGARRSGDAASLRDAVMTLRTIAPERLEGRLAFSLAMSGELPPDEAVTILPHALSAAPDAERVDSLLLLYGQAFQKVAACEDAVRIYQTLLRRSRAEREDAAASMAECAARLGDDAASLESPEAAEEWYTLALEVDSGSAAGRRALLGVAGTRTAAGDTMAALSALEAVIEYGAPTDSLSQLALQQLSALGLGAANPLEPQP